MKHEKHLEDALRPSIRLAIRLAIRFAIRPATLSLVAALGIWGAGPARSAEITVLLNQATATGVREMAAGFEKATGNKVNVDFEVGQALYQKITAGAPGDLTSLGLGQFDDFIKQEKVVPGSVVEYGRVGNGVAVKAGAPKPDISTPEAFKRAMLDAKSIGHTRVGTGPFNTKLFQKLGIYDQIKDKIKIIEGKLVAEAVADGDVEIGIQQTNVIQPVAGSEYLGPLPPELMEYGAVGIGLLAVSKQPEVAKAFIKFMADPANAALLRKGDMEPPLN
jgi:molybdate transport system substrate-binding protein